MQHFLRRFFLLYSFYVVMTVSKDTAEDKIAKKFIEKFGYRTSWSIRVSPQEFEHALSNFQSFMGITVTGVADDQTMKIMTVPRCGLKDPVRRRAHSKHLQFVAHGSKWERNGKMTLTWRIPKGSADIKVDKFVKIFQKAFLRWQKYSNIEFKQLSSSEEKKADLEISFPSGYHRDPYAFDGKGGSLGHGFYPHKGQGLSGDIHLDHDDVKENANVNLDWLATHMIGHALGIEHYWKSNSVMFPINKEFKDSDDFELSTSDIKAVQDLYGKVPGKETATTLATQKTNTTPTTTKSTTTATAVKILTTEKSTPEKVTKNPKGTTTMSAETTSTLSTAMTTTKTTIKTPATAIPKTRTTTTTAKSTRLPRTTTKKSTQTTTTATTATRTTKTQTTKTILKTSSASSPTRTRTRTTTTTETTAKTPEGNTAQPTSKSQATTTIKTPSPPTTTTPTTETTSKTSGKNTVKPTPKSQATTTIKTSSSTTTTTPTKNPLKQCPILGITAIVFYEYHKRLLVLLKDNKMILLSDNGNYFVTQRTNFIPNFKNSLALIDASLMASVKGKRYLFVFCGGKYFVYNKRFFSFSSGNHNIHNKTGPLNLNLPLWVSKIDAAMQWTKDGHIYLFYKQYYWKYDTKIGKTISPDNPARISDTWKGIPDNIDAADSGKKGTYFVKDDMMYLYDQENGKVVEGYPKPWGREILNCRKRDLVWKGY